MERIYKILLLMAIIVFFTGCEGGDTDAVQKICPDCNVIDEGDALEPVPEVSEPEATTDHSDRLADPYGTYASEDECGEIADYVLGDEVNWYFYDDTQLSYNQGRNEIRYFRWDEDGIIFIRDERFNDTLHQYNVGYTFDPSGDINIGCYVYFVSTAAIDYEVYWNGVQLR